MNKQAQFRLDRFLKERGELLHWPMQLQPQIRSLSEKLAQVVTPEVFGTYGCELREKAEAAAMHALNVPSKVSVVLGHSAIQLLEQLLITLTPSSEAYTLQNEFFLFDEVFKKLRINGRKFATIGELVESTPPEAPVLLSAPNNPTGEDLGKSDLKTLLEKRSGLVLIDETYTLFSECPNQRLFFCLIFRS